MKIATLLLSVAMTFVGMSATATNPISVHIAGPPRGDEGLLQTIDAALSSWKEDPSSPYHSAIGD